VVGTRLALHVAKDGMVYAVSGNVYDGVNLPKIPTISGPLAEARAKDAEAGQGVPLTTSARRLVYVVTSSTQEMYLAHEVLLSGQSFGQPPISELVYVDAINGQVVDIHSNIQTALNRSIEYNSYSTSYTGATVVRTEGAAATGTPAWDNAYVNVGDAHSYWLNQRGRDSYDASGATLKAITYYGSTDAVAFWDPVYKAMYFSANMGADTGYMSDAFDIVAHEMTHGVTQAESGLIYANEPGALNEAISDIFAAAATANKNGTVDSRTWECGEDVYTISTVGGAFRYMSDPNLKTDPDFYPNRVIYSGGLALPVTSNDFGGVHHNSGIANLAFYLMTVGGQHPRHGTSTAGGTIPNTSVSALHATPTTSIGLAAAIVYRALTLYLGPGAQFMDMRAATEQAAADIHGGGSAQVTTVATAWNMVGVPAFVNRYPMNISAQAYASTGADIMIGGFILSGGATSKTMLIRGLGPALSGGSFSPVLSDPELTLYDSGGTSIGYNDNWSSSGDATAIASWGNSIPAAPSSLSNPSNDSALLPTLASGGYTYHLSGVSSGTGYAKVQAYDTDSTNPNHLINLSVRAQATASAYILAEFTIGGSGNKYVLIRAVGPTLSASYGVSTALSNPRIDLYIVGNANPIFSNDNWSNDLDVTTASNAVGAFPLVASSNDAAMVVPLPAGNYRAVVSPSGSVTGTTCLLEVWEVN
jgi:Zn-dependent metalloprotease